MSAAIDDFGPRIRRMSASDVEYVAAIESSAYDYPWTRGIFRDCLLANYQAAVIEWRGRVAGYAITSIAAGEAHLLNLCVSSDCRRLGLGRMLLRYVVQHASVMGADRLFLEVRPSNEAALALYRDEGFVRTGLRRNYYRASDGKEDAVVLATSLVPSE